MLAVQCSKVFGKLAFPVLRDTGEKNMLMLLKELLEFCKLLYPYVKRKVGIGNQIISVFMRQNSNPDA